MRDGETSELAQVRFRTVGDISCTCPVESDADDVEKIIAETAVTEITERARPGWTTIPPKPRWNSARSKVISEAHEDIHIMSIIENTEDLGVLRFITAGSVDDGKSTLIGRLLYDSKAVLSDQLSALSRAKNKRTVGDVDLALLTDGLEAEREQGITIDVAYRYFATAKRKFIIADTPGHEQYTRNMVTGASTAHAAIILIDATRVTIENGVADLLPQTKRQRDRLLLALQHVIVAINKMDLVDYSEARFNEIRDAYVALAQLGLNDVRFVPVSALKGDNIVGASERMPWYAGEPLLDVLESLPVETQAHDALRFPVQWVARGTAARPTTSAATWAGSSRAK